jgi:type II secretory pathway component PulC
MKYKEDGMIQGLVIRRLFLITDFVLGLGILLVCGQVVLGLEGPTIDLKPPVSPGVTADTLLAKVEDRSAYDDLVGSGLFGDAGRAIVEGPDVPPPPPGPAIGETELDLVLVGTLALAPGDPLSSAFIQEGKGRSGAQGYAVGEDVLEEVTLLEVYPRRVILLNGKKSPAEKEYLSMDDEEERLMQMASATPNAPTSSTSSTRSTRSGSTRSPTRPRSGPRSAASGNRVVVKRDEIQKELVENGAALLQIRPVEKKDAQGNVVGLTAEGISGFPLAKKLGLRDNDVLQSINGEQIRSEQQIMEAIQKYQNSRSFQIGILRDGKPQTLNYQLDF